MKIYWQKLLWNYTVRYWHLLKYYWYGHYLSKWSAFYYPNKLLWNSKQKEQFNKLLQQKLKTLSFNKPLDQIDNEKKIIPGYYPHSDGDEF